MTRIEHPACGKTWTAGRAWHCIGSGLYDGCCETFASTTAWDAHRVGSYWPDTRRCLTPEEMRAVGLWQDTGGIWHGKRTKDGTPEKQTRPIWLARGDPGATKPASGPPGEGRPDSGPQNGVCAS